MQYLLKSLFNFIAKYTMEAAYAKLGKVMQLSLWLKAKQVGKLLHWELIKIDF